MLLGASSEVLLPLTSPIFTAGPLLGDGVCILTVIIVTTTRASVSAPLFPNNTQPLSPFIVLLVTWVMVASFLSKMSKHCGQSFAANCIRALLPSNIGTNSGEFCDRLQ